MRNGSATVAVLGVALVLVVILVLILVVVHLLILVLILVIHGFSSTIFLAVCTAEIVCPGFQNLSLGLKIRLHSSPPKIAAAMPPAQAFSPPVKIPRKPSACMASFTPLARA